MKEETVLLGRRRSLVGVLTHPADNIRLKRSIAVLLLNAGIVHRVGPGRIYVKIARELAERGFTVLRFDFSGIGDSQNRQDELPFHASAVEETQCAIDFLQVEYGIRRFLLLGGCSGASVSLDTASLETRVCGAILINFPSPEEDGNPDPDSVMRKKSHYVLNFAIRNGESWRRFFAGQVDYKRLASTVLFEIRRRVIPSSNGFATGVGFRALLESLLERGVHPIFVCSAGDARLQDLRRLGGKAFKRMCVEGKIDLTIVPRSDHTFSSLFDHARLINIVREKVEIVERSARKQLTSVAPASVPVGSLNA
jgi:pimeloyl-ACP methyl ester carboxylesterase